MVHAARRSIAGLSPDSRTASVLRVLAELVAWTATPWALWAHGVLWSVLSLVVLIGLPAVFATPGDRPNPTVPVPGVVTIAIVIMELAAAAVAVWFVWWTWLAAGCTVWAFGAAVAEQPWLRWLRGAPARRW
jgi:hypothetical protein